MPYTGSHAEATAFYLRSHSHHRSALAAPDRGARGQCVIGLSLRRFHGSVAKSTRAGIPWLPFTRNRRRPVFISGPFDSWDIPARRSALVEADPGAVVDLLRRGPHRRPARRLLYCRAWLTRANHDGTLRTLLNPDLTPAERAVASVEVGF
jgi:hypothetical protein